MLALEREEARHGRGEGQTLRIGRVDPADERLGDALERLASEPTPHEAPKALVPGAGATWQNQVESEPKLSAPG